MNLRKIAVQLFIVLSFITAVHAADFQQVQLKGPKNATNQYSGTVYGPIVSSDTLWQIATRYRKNTNHSIYQVMQAIFELNPEAFERNNRNLMRNGAILRLPSERYIAGVNRQQAQQNAERDEQLLKGSQGGQGSATSPGSSATLNQTKEIIEEKIGALDEAQKRQFMAIRKQFAESISSVQSILEENQKLFERLDQVDADIDELRSQEEIKAQQMTQMGESIEELLKRSREEQAARDAAEEEAKKSWLDNPINLILLFTLPVLILLTGFAVWMIKRKDSQTKVVEEEEEDISLDPLAAEMDDLSDALSAELSAEEGDELSDENIFGDEDILDDVLAEELEESLDDALEDSIEQPLVDDAEAFDEIGDDVLDDDFEVGAEVVEQDDLDSLFEEDDDLLAEIDEDATLPGQLDAEDEQTDGSEEQQDETEATAESEELVTEDDEPASEDPQDHVEIEEDEQAEDDALLAPVETEEQDSSPDSDEPDEEVSITPVEDEPEQPEISIDELLEEGAEKVIENTVVDDADGINEEVLQSLDKEIAAQNEELDNVTSSLIDELEQIEQMQAMEAEETEEVQAEGEEQQLDIQPLDDLVEELDPELLGDEDEDAADMAEVDISEVLEEHDANFAEPSEETPADEQSTDTQSEVESASEPEAEQSSAEQAPDTEQTTDAQSEAESVTEPVAEQASAEESLEAEQSTDAQSEAESATEPEAEQTSAEQAPEAEQSTDAQSEAESATEPEAEQAPAEQAPEAEQSEAESVIESDAEQTSAEQAPEAEQSTDAQSESKEATEPEAEQAPAEQAPEAEQSTDAQSEADSEAEPEPETAEQSGSEGEDEIDSAQPSGTDEEADAELDVDLEAELASATPSDDESTLDEDQLEKALEDFENEELDEVLEDLTSNEAESISSLDDLEFSADDFVSKESAVEPEAVQEAEQDPNDDFDDSQLDDALEELEQIPEEQATSVNDELDDVPGLGDWLDGDEKESQDEEVLDELEDASFDEMLESIDLDEALEDEQPADFDIATLLDESDAAEPIPDDIEDNEDDFLDVDALLSESEEAEPEVDLEQELDLDVPLEPFVNEQENLEMVDVDADQGLGAKLDLAHAYIEIGEEESAKELLDEIIKKGTDKQIAEAKAILDDLG